MNTCTWAGLHTTAVKGIKQLYRILFFYSVMIQHNN